MSFDPRNVTGKYVLDDEGFPVPEPDLMKWAQWMEDNHGNLHVGDDEVCGFRVSTVFLAVDMSWHGPPLLFETMIFGPEGHTLDGAQWRYTTRAQATEGHAKVLAVVRAETAQDRANAEEIVAAMVERLQVVKP